MTKGDIVLVTFPFTNLSGGKLRPAVVLFESVLDIKVCFITTQIDWKESTDVLFIPSHENGLRKESLVRTSKTATIDRQLAKGIIKQSHPGIKELPLSFPQ